jgi:hypothetical protein
VSAGWFRQNDRTSQKIATFSFVNLQGQKEKGEKEQSRYQPVLPLQLQFNCSDPYIKKAFR